jgi:hypothetical protein
MKQMVVKIDGQSFSGKCQLGWTLREFLEDKGMSPLPELLLTVEGVTIAPRYSLAERSYGKELTRCVVPEPVSAWTVDEVLLTGRPSR